MRASNGTAQTLGTERSQTSKSRLGLSCLKFGWSRGKGSRPTSAAIAPEEFEKRPWLPEEVKSLADASLRYWKSGQTVDFASLSRDWCRSAKDVRAMLEYILQGYSKFGSILYWVDEDRGFVLGWGAAEFPNSIITSSVPGESKRAKTPVNVSALEGCLSALTCRPRTTQILAPAALVVEDAADSSAFVADLTDATSGQNVVADFRETKASQKGSKAASERRVSTEPSILMADELHKIVNKLYHPFNFESPADKDINKAVSSDSSANGAGRTHSRSKSMANPHSDSNTIIASAAAAAATTTTTAAAAAAAAVGLGALPPLPSTQNSGPVNEPVPDDEDKEANDRSKAASVGKDEPKDRSGNRASKDSGNIEMSDNPATAPVLRESGLSPEDSRHTIGLNRDSTELDVQFSGVPPETKGRIRAFVDRHAQAYAKDFNSRVSFYKAGKDGFCQTIEYYSNFKYNNDAYYKAIEHMFMTQYEPASFVPDVFFHIQLLRAIERDRIPVTDDNWLSVNEYATEVFNQKIRDGCYIVLQEYTDGADGNESRPGAKEEKRSPFETAYYMCKLAAKYVRFYMEMHNDDFMRRIKEHGPRPIPVALEIQNDKALIFDLGLRELVLRFIEEDIPDATPRSKQIAFMRTLELLNHEIAIRCGFDIQALRSSLDVDKNLDEGSSSDCDILETSILKSMSPVHQARAIGKSFARGYYSDAKIQFLEAMLEDHPFKLISLNELRVWRSEGCTPAGKNVDYYLSVRLYKYMKRLRIRVSDSMWLHASASATLSMLRRVKNALLREQLLSHIDIAQYKTQFEKTIGKMGDDASTCSSEKADAMQLRLSAFGAEPAVDLHSINSSNPLPTHRTSENAVMVSRSISRSTTDASKNATGIPATVPTELISLPTRVTGPDVPLHISLIAHNPAEQPSLQRRFSVRDNASAAVFGSQTSAEPAANKPIQTTDSLSSRSNGPSVIYTSLSTPHIGVPYCQSLESGAALTAARQPTVSADIPSAHITDGYTTLQQTVAQQTYHPSSPDLQHHVASPLPAAVAQSPIAHSQALHRHLAQSQYNPQPVQLHPASGEQYAVPLASHEYSQHHSSVLAARGSITNDAFALTNGDMHQEGNKLQAAIYYQNSGDAQAQLPSAMYIPHMKLPAQQQNHYYHQHPMMAVPAADDAAVYQPRIAMPQPPISQGRPDGHASQSTMESRIDKVEVAMLEQLGKIDHVSQLVAQICAKMDKQQS
ncbi:hypothetical protein GGI12_001828 [Dipsacomyces acuminosporus]|nr:hypothetical protein GGI12_001828 [Dipsacomyces acuminosporus]